MIFTEDVERIFGKRKFASKELEEALYATKIQTPPPHKTLQPAENTEKQQPDAAENQPKEEEKQNEAQLTENKDNC